MFIHCCLTHSWQFVSIKSFHATRCGGICTFIELFLLENKNILYKYGYKLLNKNWQMFVSKVTILWRKNIISRHRRKLLSSFFIKAVKRFSTLVSLFERCITSSVLLLIIEIGVIMSFCFILQCTWTIIVHTTSKNLKIFTFTSYSFENMYSYRLINCRYFP
jgi:hypothetical protein